MRGRPPPKVRTAPILAGLLRLARTSFLRLVSPLDVLARRIAGRRPLPPLWLRRHAGRIGRFESAARDMAAILDRLGFPGPADDVLDVGCGPGAMVPEFARRLGPGRRYVGFDVHAPSIRWCRKAFGADPRFSFEIAAVASPFGAASGAPAAGYRFPMEDGRAGFVLAKSVFTHLFEEDARHYLAEIRRTLVPGRAAIVTAFLFDAQAPELAGAAAAFPFGDRAVRWRSRLRPASAVAYGRDSFFAMVEAAGLRVQWLSPGYFPGAPRLTGQDILLLGL